MNKQIHKRGSVASQNKKSVVPKTIKPTETTNKQPKQTVPLGLI